MNNPCSRNKCAFSVSVANKFFCSITFFLVAEFFFQSQLIRNPFQFFKKMREALPPLAKRVWIRPFNLLQGLQSSGEQRTSGYFLDESVVKVKWVLVSQTQHLIRLNISLFLRLNISPCMFLRLNISYRPSGDGRAGRSR